MTSPLTWRIWVADLHGRWIWDYVPPERLGHVLGVAKAYTTRVGLGPFPTEIDGHVADYLRERGREYGATTGRPRRIGWLDLVQLRSAVRTNGMTRDFSWKASGASYVTLYEAAKRSRIPKVARTSK